MKNLFLDYMTSPTFPTSKYLLIFCTTNYRSPQSLKQQASTTSVPWYIHISLETVLTGGKREGKCVINDRVMVISAGWLTDPTTRLHRSQSTASLISTHYYCGYTSHPKLQMLLPAKKNKKQGRQGKCGLWNVKTNTRFICILIHI